MDDDVLFRVTELLSFNSYAVCKTSNKFFVASFAIQTTDGKWTTVKCLDILGVRIPAYFTKNPTLLADHISNFHTILDDVFGSGQLSQVSFVHFFPKRKIILIKTENISFLCETVLSLITSSWTDNFCDSRITKQRFHASQK